MKNIKIENKEYHQNKRQLKAKLISSKKLSIEEQKQIVYLFGVSSDQKEIDMVIEHAKSIKGVLDIINYIEEKHTGCTPGGVTRFIMKKIPVINGSVIFLACNPIMTLLKFYRGQIAPYTPIEIH